MQYLLEKGADIRARGNDARTAVQVATDEGHSEILQILQPGGLILQDMGWNMLNND